MSEAPTRGLDGGGERLDALVRLSAALAVGDAGDWRDALERAGSVASPAAAEEVVLQSYLFVGFPVVLNALAVQRELAETPDERPDPDLGDRRAAGEALCRRIYGPAYERLRAHVAALHPDFDRWMIEEGYGKTLSRPGLHIVERELCVVGLLAAGGHVPQLRSHARGSLNVGASVAEVSAAVEAGLDTAARVTPVGAAERARDVRAAWDQVRVRAGGR